MADTEFSTKHVEYLFSVCIPDFILLNLMLKNELYKPNMKLAVIGVISKGKARISQVNQTLKVTFSKEFSYLEPFHFNNTALWIAS